MKAFCGIWTWPSGLHPRLALLLLFEELLLARRVAAVALRRHVLAPLLRILRLDFRQAYLSEIPHYYAVPETLAGKPLRAIAARMARTLPRK
jgi:hypothetical protein